MTMLSASLEAAAVVIFAVLASVAMLLCIVAGAEPDDLADFYTGYGTLTPLTNGLAIAGDYISVATVLSTTGIVALSGYDGFVLVLSTVLSLVLLMTLLAEPLSRAGRFTVGDVLARRMPGRAVRIVACAVTLATALPFLLVQLSVAGSLVTFILGITLDGARATSICVVGVLMIAYAAVGGMKGTAAVQIIKMVMLIGACLLLTLSALGRFGWDGAALLQAARDGSGAGVAYLRQGLEFGRDTRGQLDFLSVQLSVVLGAGCLPHVTMRMNSGPDTPAIRRSMSWAVGSVAVLALLLSVVGAAAAAVVGRGTISGNNAQGSTSLLLLARMLVTDVPSFGQTVIYATVAGAVFMTLLASVAGLTLAAATSIAHDLYACVLRRGRSTEHGEMTVARWAIVGVGLPAIALGVLVRNWNLQVLIAVAFCIGASAVAPALIYSLFWRGFTRTGLLWTLVGGTVSTIVLMVFSAAVSGTPTAVFPTHDFHWFPLQTTGIVTVPLGFLAGWLGSRRESRLTAAATPAAQPAQAVSA